MKRSFNTLFFIIFSTVGCFISCTDNDSDSDLNKDNKNVSGTIQLSGEDTSETGTSLTVGNFAIGRIDLTGTTESVILLDKSVDVTNDELIFNNLKNNFIIVAADFDKESSTIDKSLSINITVDGKEFKYACATPNTTFTDCGTNYKVDFTTQEVIFDNTTVINTSSNKILTLNGIVTWQ